MKRLLKILVILGILGGLGTTAVSYGRAYWKTRNKTTYRQTPVVAGDITYVVNSTGTVQPIRRVQVGSFVSGPIKDLCVDFNSEVHKDEVLAIIDPRIYDASVARDQAARDTSQAEVKRVQAQLNQAEADYQRALKLIKKAEAQGDQPYISEAEIDQLRYAVEAFAAQRELTLASVKQAEANLKQSEANREYTRIRSPEDGIIIDRKVDRGQTVAASFQTPELFTVAPQLREKVRVFASVDEADIGYIRKAKEEKRPVHFTVDAYPDDLFQGEIPEDVGIRMNPTTTQNVVTYTVVVDSPNPELKLLPGMTANLSFEIDRHEKVLKIPNAALRFYPRPEMVREEDRKLLEGTEDPTKPEENGDAGDKQRSATERAQAAQIRNRRHVWVVEGDFLRAVEVVIGLSDFQYTEMVSGNLQAGQELVTMPAPRTP